ncbi:MAG: sugar ABC transporter permease [Nitrososphaeria archaeon]
MVDRTKLLFILPSISIILFLTGYPVIYLTAMSFYKLNIYTYEYTFIGPRNFLSLINDPIFKTTLENTLFWTFMTTTGALLLGLLGALLLNEENIKFKGIFSAILFLPFALGYVEAGYCWLWFTNPTLGLFNYILKAFGLLTDIRISLLGSRWSALSVVILAQIWKHFPFMTLMLRAGLQSIRKELYESAEVDGAGIISKFRNITIPQIKPVLVFSTLLMLIWNFNSFTLIWVITQGGPFGQTHIFSTLIYSTAFISFDIGKAAVTADIVFIIVFLIATIYLRAVKYGT